MRAGAGSPGNFGTSSGSNAAASATGSAVPASASYSGLNVGGNLRGATGVNPSGSVFAQQMDIASVNGATVVTGNGTASGAMRVSIASDNTAFAVKPTDGTNPIFGTAAAMADTVANPTLGSIQSYLKAYNGSTWDRLICFFLTADGQGVQTGLYTLPQNLVYNGSTWDRMRGTTAGTFMQGSVATNVAITANPINLGAQAVSSENSAVTTARQVQLVADLVGKLIVLPYANPENFVSGRATATDTTSTSLIAAPASGLRNYITQITVWNASAVATYIKLQDGSGGTELYDLPAPAGGGVVITLPTPIRQPTTATALFFAANASANAVFISASGYKGA